ncbi:probable maltase-glucoamylase 2 [Haliotis cracherodii]|uniref:probable maltase-glucoamylase 2 n=1 Tax=Haliotis cracherodii TaxID=6455 RepID=UPI0039EB2CD6
MDTNTIFVAALILHFSLSVASKGQFDGIPDMILSGSVFQIFRRTTLQQCRRLCGYSSRCLSINWSSLAKECQLNSKTGNRESLQVSHNNIYLQDQQMTQQAHPCANQPCSTNHMCIPVNTAKAHICVRLGVFIPQTTEAGMATASATNTTATATVPSQAASSTTSIVSPPSLEVSISATTTAPTTTPALTTTTNTSTPTTTPASTTTTTPTTTPISTFTTITTTTTTTTTPTAITPKPASTHAITIPDTTEFEMTSLETTTTTPAPTTSAPASTSTTELASRSDPYNGTCVTDVDCATPPERTCSGGVCICSIGYDMDETSVVCRKLTECSSLGSEFTLHVDKYIKQTNFKTIDDKTPEECAQLCLEADTVCRSFEFGSKTCHLQEVTWFSVNSKKRKSSSGARHHQRRCNW